MIEGPPTWDDFVLALDLFRDPILCGVFAGAVLGYLAVFVILRRMVFATAALTQSAGLGVALAFAAEIHLGLHLSPVLGAVMVSLAAAALVTIPMDRLKLSRETMLALVWLVGAAGAVLVGSRISQEAHDISAILFGSAVLVRPVDLYLVAGVGMVVLGIGVWLQRSLVFAGFDPDGARVQGIGVGWLEVLLLVLLTVEVSVATRAIGALPVFALSVLPGMAALLLAPRLSWAFPLAVVCGATSGLFGYIMAFICDFPVGASQAMVALSWVVPGLVVRMFR